MTLFDSKSDDNWLSLALEALKFQGFAIVTNVLSADFLKDIRPAMYRAQESCREAVGIERLERAKELGVIRLPMQFESIFFKLLELPELLAVVDNTVSPTAVMHLQNGFILPSLPADASKKVFQNTYHMDFPRVLNEYPCSINLLFAIDEFTSTNGATRVVPASHQSHQRPTEEYCQRSGIDAICPAGSMVVFDSTLWHAAGFNVSGKDRLAINHQFTRSYFKQQIDYVRALGEGVISKLPDRSQQMLGWYTRVVTSLDEYYQPPEKRLYRGGQG